MSGCAFVSIVYKLGIKAEDESMAKMMPSGMFDFYPPQSKRPNYLQYCTPEALNTEEVPTDLLPIFHKYTEHTTQHCTKVNLCLACDSPQLSEHGLFVRQLNHAIVNSPLDICADAVYRGVLLSPTEIAKMEEHKHFFIPSFTSTSVDRSKCYSKEHLLVIKPGWTQRAASITAEMSPYYDSEREVLLGSYTSFWLERIEKVNDQQVLTLAVDDHASLLPELACSPTEICAKWDR
eukprot:TRINITY_DN5185_c0_g1_i1.p1 TRINITY_DN5185_c0_g1~~TRINITY_DN5185_c0_g1_i1.p1  ORF type:complete len:235 (-),score=11.99 TRINITY_DN5185_c0_g1_i1:93-797(-)